MMGNRKQLGYVRALAAMVAVAICVGCGTHFVTISVTRPAAINMKDFDTIALGRIIGGTSDIFSAELTKAISKSGQFEVLSSEALALQRMESNEATGKTALVSGSISFDYDEGHSTTTLEDKDKETGEVKSEKTLYHTRGRATVTASLSIVDLHTSEVLVVKEFKESSFESKTSHGPSPDKGASFLVSLLGFLFGDDNPYPDLNKRALLEECQEKIIQSFMHTVAPYTEHVRVSI